MIVNIGCETFNAEFHISRFMNNKPLKMCKNRKQSVAWYVYFRTLFVVFIFTLLCGVWVGKMGGKFTSGYIYQRKSKRNVRKPRKCFDFSSFINKHGRSLEALYWRRCRFCSDLQKYHENERLFALCQLQRRYTTRNAN